MKASVSIFDYIGALPKSIGGAVVVKTAPPVVVEKKVGDGDICRASVLGRIGGWMGGAKGGKNRWAKLSPEERSAAASAMVNARWAKRNT